MIGNNSSIEVKLYLDVLVSCNGVKALQAQAQLPTNNHNTNLLLLPNGIQELVKPYIKDLQDKNLLQQLSSAVNATLQDMLRQ
jgi:hypothetical protein